MIKFLPSLKSIYYIVFCLVLSASVCAQTKSTKGGKEKEKGSQGTSLEHSGGMAIPLDHATTVSKKESNSEKGYKYLVYVNVADGLAYQIWSALPGLYADFRTASLSGSNNVFVLVSKNPEMALFKRAYGSYFQIFSEEDLQYFSGSNPCLAEMIPTMEQIAKKLSAN